MRCRWSVAAALALAALAASEAKAEDPVDFVRREVGAMLTLPERYELLAADGDRAVVAVTALAPAAEIAGVGQAPAERMSVYVYLAKKGETWTLSRSPWAVPNGLRIAAARLRSLPASEASSGGAEAERSRARLLLATSADDALVSHFHAKRAAFDAILAKALAWPAADSESQRMAASDPDHAALFADAGIAYGDRLVLGDDVSERSGCEEPGCLTLAVAFSPPEYKVGYFHMAGSAAPPRMSAREYMVIRPLGDGWHFFRQN